MVLKSGEIAATQPHPHYCSHKSATHSLVSYHEKYVAIHNTKMNVYQGIIAMHVINCFYTPKSTKRITK